MASLLLSKSFGGGHEDFIWSFLKWCETGFKRILFFKGLDRTVQWNFLYLGCPNKVATCPRLLLST